MKRLILMALIVPTLAFASHLSNKFDISIQILQLGDVEGVYLLKWDDTYWSPVDQLVWCMDGEECEPDDGFVEDNLIDPCDHFIEMGNDYPNDCPSTEIGMNG